MGVSWKIDCTGLILFMCLSLLAFSAKFHILYVAPHRQYFFMFKYFRNRHVGIEFI